MDKMEKFNKVIDNAIEKLNALREDKPEFKKGELVWVKDEPHAVWYLNIFISETDNGLYRTKNNNILGEGVEWKYCKKFDEIEIDI